MNSKKIIVAGLDNSGKSSLILSLMGVKRLSAYTHTEPTRGIEQINMSKLSQDFVIWDIGGQNQTREDFLKDFHKNITDTDKIIYLIDIRDKERYSTSLKYLENIINSLKREKILIKFSVFLHKFDPDFKIEKDLLANLLNSIGKVFPQEISYEINKTTIFTSFRKMTIIE